MLCYERTHAYFLVAHMVTAIDAGASVVVAVTRTNELQLCVSLPTDAT